MILEGYDFEGYDINGVVWFRQEFQFSGDTRSDSLALFLGPIKHLNSTFLNGKLIGRKEHWGSNQGDVVYKISSKELKKGKNILSCSSHRCVGNGWIQKRSDSQDIG